MFEHLHDAQVVGHPSALTLAASLVRSFGVVSSVGVHQAPPLPFTGRDAYNRNISFDFGRCPVRAMLPIAMQVLIANIGVFGDVGGKAGLVERVISMKDAKVWYEKFEKGDCGKVLFDPWA
jgi:threonine dehydrogenase-like Zn-dependent dehydrogenase